MAIGLGRRNQTARRHPIAWRCEVLRLSELLASQGRMSGNARRIVIVFLLRTLSERRAVVSGVTLPMRRALMPNSP